MLHQLLQRSLHEDPQRRLLEFHGRFWTAAELDDAARRLAGNLSEAGVEAVDRVAVLLPNCPETVVAYLACFKANFVIVPLDYRHRAPQIGFALGHSGASVLIVQRERVDELEAAGLLAGVPHVLVVGGDARGRPRLEEFVAHEPSAAPTDTFAGDDLCVMIYTSGTTSRPKGVTLTRNAMIAGIKKYLACVPLNKDDVALIAAPITRPMALRSQLLPLLYVGGCSCLIERFEPGEYIAALGRPPAKTYLALLPAALGQLLAMPAFAALDFRALRLCVAGGDRVPPRLHEAFAAATGVPITEQCGASEIGPFALNPPFGRKKAGSIGLPMYGTQISVVDARGDDVGTNQTGEILVNSPTMMVGYWNDTALTRKTMPDGRIRTGDLGRFDEDGYLWFMGRKKDVIVRGGSNISPLEVETVLLGHADVAEACVIGLLDPQWGQIVHATVVLRPNATATPQALREFCREHLADYMVPEVVQLIEEMPTKGPGKIDRDLLRLRAEIRPLLEQVPFFRHAGGELVRELVTLVLCRHFAAGETIVRQGEVGDAMYFLTRGRVEVAERGGRVLAELSEGSYFGEVAILMEVPRTATVRALVDCEVYELKRAGVLELAQDYPEFAQQVEESARRHYNPGA